MNPRSLKITISNPCSQNWDEMKISEAGRFCTSCSKNVIDFLGLSDDQIKQYVKQHASEEICGRFYTHQIERIRIEFDENILQSDIRFWQKFLVVLLVCFGSDAMGIDFCLAQAEVQDTTIVAVDTIAVSQNVDTAIVTEVVDTTLKLTPLDTNYKFPAQMMGRSICAIENFPWITMGAMASETPDEDQIFEPKRIIELFEEQTIVDSQSVKNSGINLNIQTRKPINQKEEEERNQDLRKFLVLSPFLKRRRRRKKQAK